MSTVGTGTEARIRRAADRADSPRYKSEQQRQWDGTVRELRTWWPAFQTIMEPVTRAMVAHADLRVGAQVVDVACGFGEPALTVAAHVGPTGRVVATDLSAGMLAVARERAATLDLSNVDFVQMDAEQPVLSAGRYHGVVCRLGLMFLPDLPVALRRLGSLLVPGGRFVAAVWAAPEDNGWLTAALGTVAEFVDLPAAAPGGLGPFALAGTGRLEGALAGAGFVRLREQRVPLRFSWPSAAAYAAYHRSSPLARLLADEPPARRRRAWGEVAATAERRWGSGALHLPGEVVVVSGTWPRDPSLRAESAMDAAGGLDLLV